MAELKHRLMQYGALAAAIPAAGAQGAIVANPNLDLVILPGQSAFIDFGPGFGEVFRFELRTHNTASSDRSVSVPSYYNAFFQFNPGNGNGINAGGFMGEASSSSSGGSFVGNDPIRLAANSMVSVGRAFYEPMSTSFGTQHDIANQSSNTLSFPARYLSGYGSWFPDARGYIGFKMFKDGSFHFGWFDVETLNWGGDPYRNNTGLPELIIHGWGFSDEPGTGVLTGQIPTPAAGGLLALALGAAGIRRARRDGELAAA